MGAWLNVWILQWIEKEFGCIFFGFFSNCTNLNMGKDDWNIAYLCNYVLQGFEDYFDSFCK